ncbi:MFS transporter [Isoptericola variabilis J7]|uniref:Major facilitator superfamily MFS_1 n=1 Tax=Isoptericola variabilis (strain 225) TaxID=743718 RepID=F6FRS2_ISOV2|nr:MFS transporter [Isoptericola variabilis]AEG43013.1 major facilitator superfamily MFS_1 [Isoptericola variabilis 225]TWH30120.1 MFS transporter [Isoptericola variabilis J7]
MVVVLAVTQTVGYGVLLYALPLLLVPVAASLQVSTVVVAGAATTFAVLVAAIDDPARRRRAILGDTLVAGFASSIFFPLTGLLADRLGWRTALLCLAGLLAVVAVPGHALVVPGGGPRAARVPDGGARLRPDTASSGASGARHGVGAGVGVREALHDGGFWVATVAFVAQTLAVSAVGTLLVAHLVGAGHGATVAASVAGLLGVLSVAGRVVFSGVSARAGVATVTAAVFAVQGIGALALPHAGGSGAVVACVVAFGLGFGVATIARPALLLERYGSLRYATIAGAMAAPLSLARAGAPLGGAAVGDPAFLTWAGVACLLAAVLLATLRRA